MLNYYPKYGRIFYAPEGGSSGSGGGSTGNPGAQQGGATSGGGNAPEDPWAGIDLDDLPPEVKTKIEKAKAGFATMQTQLQQGQQLLQQTDQKARQFQSAHDKLLAQLQQVSSGQPGAQPNQDPKELLTSQIEKILISKGIPEAQAKAQAPIHAELLQLQSETLKKEIGTGLQPVVGSVLQNQALTAWQQVQAADKLGAFSVPEIAQATWANVEHMLNSGQPVTPEVIANLKNMNFAAYVEQHGMPTQQHQQQQQPITTSTVTPQYPTVATRFTYPGAGNAPSMPAVPDANAARTTLNEDTRVALSQTFAKLHPTIRPKAFGGK